jgi:hypothetical protein
VGSFAAYERTDGSLALVLHVEGEPDAWVDLDVRPHDGIFHVGLGTSVLTGQLDGSALSGAILDEGLTFAAEAAPRRAHSAGAAGLYYGTVHDDPGSRAVLVVSGSAEALAFVKTSDLATSLRYGPSRFSRVPAGLTMLAPGEALVGELNWETTLSNFAITGTYYALPATEVEFAVVREGTPGGVGEPCVEDRACQVGTSISSASCLTEQLAAWPGGYCTIPDCTTDEDCGVGARCASVRGAPLCLAACGTTEECRPGYACHRVSDGVCLPACRSDADCTDPTTCDATTGECRRDDAAPDAPDTSDEGSERQAGCGCRTAEGGSGPGPLVWMAVLLGVLTLRGRPGRRLRRSRRAGRAT